tara:strand:- start:804 stop:1499 length:696 start_codon:yes stop_codon:yes gene_type:complete
MRVLSIDVGIKNLSYVFIEINSIKPLDWNIITWNNINVMHTYDDLQYVCNEYTKWQKPMLQECLRSLKVHFPENKMTKSELQIILRDFLKSKSVKKESSINLQKLVKNIKAHFDEIFDPKLCDAVVIENQPCMKNPQMKTMQMMVFTYFCLIPDTSYLVKCIPATQKMRVCKNMNWIKTIPKGYANTKKTSIEVVTNLLGDNQPESWIKATKKDDMSDVILQAFAYCDKFI